ncbi:MAG: pantoate--beta-alanine ligase [Flavobacteriales bacterium]|nr:pantoate--beta-alanine ligase [Flavobacteriales bacterium]
MELIVDPARATTWSATQRRSGRKVALVPTMGALHAGHLALVEAAREGGNTVGVSIFVNPLQFNNADDLAKYPRQLEQDRALLEKAGCDMLFAPEKEGIFAGFTPQTYDLAPLDQVLEGPSRPGHFQGVVNVVERLFFHVRPDVALFGEKDRQQLAIIQHAATTHHWPERIVGLPTVRSAEGLALSSRNQRLSPAERTTALVLYRSLQAAAALAFKGTVTQAEEAGRNTLAAEPGVVTDYFAIAHPRTLQPIADWNGLDEAVALVAAQVGPVRLIDNITLRR